MDKKVLIPVIMGACLCFSPLPVKAEEYYKWDSKVTPDKNKIWTVKFSKKLNDNMAGIKDKIYITDSKGNKLDCNIRIAQDKKTLEILPPKDVYKELENYYLYIDKGISSDKKQNLKKPVKMNFYIDGYIEFEDKNLEQEVRKAANPKDRPKGPLKYTDVSGITKLDIHNKNIKSLKGIEYLKNIRELDISDNKITDISHIKGLDSLEKINLYNNNIENIYYIGTLDKLKYLNLAKNKVGDISPLKKLNYLEQLDLRYNKIEKIDSLDGKTSLVHLFISNNNIKDFSPISKLKYLKSLYLINNYSLNYDYAKAYYNNIKDKDFKLNTPIQFKDKVFEDLIRKEINKASGYVYASDLENIKQLDLHNAHVEELNGIENMKSLEKLNLRGTDIDDISLLKALGNLKDVDISDTKVSDIKALENSPYIKYLNINKTAVSNLEPIKNMKHMEKLYVSQTKVHNIPILTNLKELDLSMCDITANNSFLTPFGNLTYLDLREVKVNGNKLSSIDDIKYLKNLQYLNIAYTDVNKIDMVKELINLRKIDITGCSKISTEVLNHLSSVEIVGNEMVMFADKALEKEIRELIKNYSEPIYKRQLSSITKLELSGKGIRDLQGIESMKDNLIYLDLSNNEITDIKVIKELKYLNKLVLHKNKIGSIKPIENLKYLKELDLSNNIIGDITLLGGLSQLTRLDLSKNGVVHVASLAGLKNLQYLSLYENKISEGEEALKKLYNLKELYLKNSGISNFDVTLAYYNNLEKRDFTTHSDFIVFDEKSESDLAKITRKILGRDKNTNVYKNDVDNITTLDLSKKRIQAEGLKAELNLTGDNLINLDGIQYFSNLSSLDLNGDERLEGIENLIPLTKLNKLDLKGRKGTSLDDIKYLNSLQYLYLNDMSLDGSLLFLENLTNLKSLDLSNNNISNISILKDLKELNKLYLGKNNITDLSILGGLTKLVTLDLVGNDNITNINPLKSLVNLKSLTLPIPNPKKITDYSPVLGYYYNLTYKNFDLDNSSVIVIKQIKDIEKEVNKGAKFILPDFVEGIMSDGTKDNFKVHWNGNSVDTSKPGIYTYTGTVEGYGSSVKLTLKVNGEVPYGMGNSSANILNKGFIVKDNEYMYYVNKENGNGKIYRSKINSTGYISESKVNGKDDKLLSSNSADFLNIYGNYIYYLSNGSIYRVRKDGSGEEKLKDASASYMTLYNNWIYYFDKSKGGIHKIKIDKTGYSAIVTEGKWREDSYFAVSGDWIYYINYADNSSIYKIKNDATGKVKVNNIPCSQMNVIGNYIYYVSQGNLYKIALNGSNNTLLYSGNITNINTYGNHIYYIDNKDNNGLYKMRLDGSYRIKTIKRPVKYINILEGKVYYIPLDNEDKIYKLYEE